MGVAVISESLGKWMKIKKKIEIEVVCEKRWKGLELVRICFRDIERLCEGI